MASSPCCDFAADGEASTSAPSPAKERRLMLALSAVPWLLEAGFVAPLRARGRWIGALAAGPTPRGLPPPPQRGGDARPQIGRSDRILGVEDRGAGQGLARARFFGIEHGAETALAVQRLDALDERLVFFDRGSDLRGGAAQQLGNEAMAKLGDFRSAVGVARLDGDVAFGIDRHRPVVEVRGSDAQEAIIDDDQLRVDLDVDANPIAAHARIEDAQPAPAICRGEPAQQAVAIAAHHQLLQIAARPARHDDDDLRPLRLLQASGEDVAYGFARQILGFDIDGAAGARQSRAVERRDLAHRMSRLAGERPGDACRNLAEVGFERRWPCARPLDRLFRHGLARREAPTLAGEFRQRPCGRTLDQHLQIVNRPVYLARRRDAAGMLWRMILEIPAVAGEIDAADKGDVVVDRDKLRVMRGRESRRLIAMLEAAFRLREMAQRRRRFTVSAIENRAIPQQ